mgnify:CR=1 FL=1
MQEKESQSSIEEIKPKKTNGSDRVTGPPRPAILEEPPKVLTENQKMMRLRIVVIVGLVLLSAILPQFVEKRPTDPFGGLVMLEPLSAIFMFLPLSIVFGRTLSIIGSTLLGLTPCAILLYVRIFQSERDLSYGASSDMPFLAMLFLGACTFAVCALFGKLTKR